MSIEMKYFVLKPQAKSKEDLYSQASQRAMFIYADMIETDDPDLANSLREWASKEAVRQENMT